MRVEMKREDGGPAFSMPMTAAGERILNAPKSGMTLRDYFAAKAMQGLCGNEDWLNKAAKNTGDPLRSCAFAAYEMADAMLEARKS